MMRETSFEVEQAMAFLKTRILAQAAEEGVGLSSVESASLMYSEPNATPEERDLMDKVDAETGTVPYEEKITRLIRNAYRSDVARGAKAEWDRSLRALRYEDRYVLVMVREALRSGTTAHDQWRLLGYGLLTATLMILVFVLMAKHNVNLPRLAGEAILIAIAVALFLLSRYMERRKTPE